MPSGLDRRVFQRNNDEYARAKANHTFLNQIPEYTPLQTLRQNPGEEINQLNRNMYRSPLTMGIRKPSVAVNVDQKTQYNIKNKASTTPGTSERVMVEKTPRERRASTQRSRDLMLARARARQSRAKSYYNAKSVSKPTNLPKSKINTKYKTKKLLEAKQRELVANAAIEKYKQKMNTGTSNIKPITTEVTILPIAEVVYVSEPKKTITNVSEPKKTITNAQIKTPIPPNTPQFKSSYLLKRYKSFQLKQKKNKELNRQNITETSENNIKRGSLTIHPKKSVTLLSMNPTLSNTINRAAESSADRYDGYVDDSQITEEKHPELLVPNVDVNKPFLAINVTNAKAPVLEGFLFKASVTKTRSFRNVFSVNNNSQIQWKRRFAQLFRDGYMQCSTSTRGLKFNDTFGLRGHRLQDRAHRKLQLSSNSIVKIDETNDMSESNTNLRYGAGAIFTFTVTVEKKNSSFSVTFASKTQEERATWMSAIIYVIESF